jgi:hypothetical protein
MSYKRMSLFVGLTGIIIGAAPLFAADHREAPLIREDITADIADVYAFRNPHSSDKLVLAMTVNPFSVPEESITFNFSPNVRYRFNIDNDGDARADHQIDVNFAPTLPKPQRLEAVFRPLNPRSGSLSVRGDVTSPTEEPEAEEPIILEGPPGSGIRVFAGPREDPFFFDIVGFFRLVEGTGSFTGADSFAGFNVSAIVVELPLDRVTNGSDQLQIWAETARRQTTTINTHVRSGKRALMTHEGEFVQVERMGNPTINTGETLIPSELKDLYNFGAPRHDAEDFAETIVEGLMALGTDATHIGILASVAVPDTLKLDLNEEDGFPNGRRLEDDVIDTVLFLVFNQPPPDEFEGDKVDENDREFLDEFPFLAAPFPAVVAESE